jgi:hypothetical protein
MPRNCKDCGVDTFPRTHGSCEDYMVHHAIWLAAGMQDHRDGEGASAGCHNYLCVGCLEKRLGRELTAADFIDVPINRETDLDTPRLRARKRQ